MGAGLELGGHVRVHGYHQISFVGHFSVSFLDLFGDPLLEDISEDGCADIDDPLLGNLGHIWFIREVDIDHRLVGEELHDFIYGESLVLGHMTGFDVIIVDPGLLAADDVLQEVDGHVVCWK